jgi:hypothetical protein
MLDVLLFSEAVAAGDQLMPHLFPVNSLRCLSIQPFNHSTQAALAVTSSMYPHATQSNQRSVRVCCTPVNDTWLDTCTNQVSSDKRAAQEPGAAAGADGAGPRA